MNCPVRQGVPFQWIVWKGLRILVQGQAKGQTVNVCEPWPLLHTWNHTQVMCKGMGMAVFQRDYLQEQVRDGLDYMERYATVCQSLALDPCFSKSGPQASKVSITWEFVRKEEYRLHQTYWIWVYISRSPTGDLHTERIWETLAWMRGAHTGAQVGPAVPESPTKLMKTILLVLRVLDFHKLSENNAKVWKPLVWETQRTPLNYISVNLLKGNKDLSILLILFSCSVAFFFSNQNPAFLFQTKSPLTVAYIMNLKRTEC